MTPDEKITALLHDVAGYWDGYHSTHHEFCYRVHAGCLAHRIRKLMTEPGEWEYAREADGYWNDDDTVFTAEDYYDVGDEPVGALARRRKAGPWEPVP